MMITRHSDYRAVTRSATEAGLPVRRIHRLTAALINGDIDTAARILGAPDAHKLVRKALRSIDVKFVQHSHGSDLLTDLEPSVARKIFCHRRSASLIYRSLEAQQNC